MEKFKPGNYGLQSVLVLFFFMGLFNIATAQEEKLKAATRGFGYVDVNMRMLGKKKGFFVNDLQCGRPGPC